MESLFKYPRGSVWRKWDLHVHSPASYGGSYDVFCKNLRNSEAEVVGINDYCTINGYKEIIKFNLGSKVIFPVIELRMNTIILNKKDPMLKRGTKINFHIIFNNDAKIIKRIETWLNSLDCFCEGGKSDKLGNISEVKEYRKITFDYFKVIKTLESDSNLKNQYLIWLPYDEYGGVDDIDPETDGYFKMGLISKAQLLGSARRKQIEFFLWCHDKYSEEKIKFWLNDRKIPCIKGSDAHKIDYPFGKLKDDKSQPTNKYCWIKADLTFEGLRQVLREPQERIFIGEKPHQLRNFELNKPKYIKSISIQKTKDAKSKNVWFNNSLILNNGLVAIIGNRGMGKSALAETIGLLGGTRKFKYFTFLNKDKFRKNKLAENFVATIEWEDGTPYSANLQYDPKNTDVERVKCIPQNHLENLCNELDYNFQSEINETIFSHIEEPHRLGEVNLENLITLKTAYIDETIKIHILDIEKLNEKLVNLEDKTKAEYHEKLTNRLMLLMEEHKVHKRNKPKAVSKPKKETKIIKEQNQKLRTLEKEIGKLQRQIKINEDKLNICNTKIAHLDVVKGKIENFKLQYGKLKKELDPTIKELLNIKLIDIVSITYNEELITDLEDNLLKEKLDLEKLVKKRDWRKRDQNINLYYHLKMKKDKAIEIRKKLSEPSSTYQSYLQDLKDWQTKLDVICNNKKNVKYEIRYIKTTLMSQIAELREKREKSIIQIFELLNQKIHVYKELYKPVIDFINIERDRLKRNIEFLNFSVDLCLTRDFFAKFFSFIDRGKKGSFQGVVQSENRLKEIAQKHSFLKKANVFTFLDEIFDNLNKEKFDDGREEVRYIEDQLAQGREKVELYNYLFSLQFLEINYQLRWGGKSLYNLSPGERGILLLIFYLLIDNDDRPLIIDQPEGNLDNESIYLLLVPYIRKAKQQRQIILVTHNPNLAVVCDAEQIIHTSIEKQNKNIVIWKSGSIENSIMNKRILDVLEGTKPAFEEREYKYGLKF